MFSPAREIDGGDATPTVYDVKRDSFRDRPPSRGCDAAHELRMSPLTGENCTMPYQNRSGRKPLGRHDAWIGRRSVKTAQAIRGSRRTLTRKATDTAKAVNDNAQQSQD